LAAMVVAASTVVVAAAAVEVAVEIAGAVALS
jgi:hypothetical protein